MSNDMLTALTNEFKNRLRITWEDTNENQIISDLIRNGNAYLSSTAMGQEIDYNSDLYAKELLYNYVLYSRSDALHSFRDAYSSELLRLRISYRHKLALQEAKNR